MTIKVMLLILWRSCDNDTDDDDDDDGVLELWGSWRWRWLRIVSWALKSDDVSLSTYWNQQNMMMVIIIIDVSSLMIIIMLHASSRGGSGTTLSLLLVSPLPMIINIVQYSIVDTYPLYVYYISPQYHIYAIIIIFIFIIIHRRSFKSKVQL